MRHPALNRRSLLKAAGLAPVATLGIRHQHPRPVPFTAGTRPPKHKPPAGAVDTHMHIFEPDRFPYPNPTSTPPAPNSSNPSRNESATSAGTSRST